MTPDPSTSAPASTEDELIALRAEVEAMRDQLARMADDCGCLGPAGCMSGPLRQIVQNNIDGMVVVDGEGFLQFANPAAEELFGSPLSSMVGLPFGYPISTGPAEIDLATADGRHVVVEMRRSDIFWDTRPASLLSFRDITARKLAEEEIERAKSELASRVEERTRELTSANRRLEREAAERRLAVEALMQSEARYRAILEDQTELICRYLPDGRLSYVNEAYARYFGKNPHELIDRNFIPHIPTEDLALIKERIEALTPRDPVASFEHRILMADGSVRWQAWTHRVVFAPDGLVVEYQAVGRDITKRKLAEEELRENREFLRLVIDTLPSPIYVKNRDGRFTLVNRAMADLYGSTPEAMIGHTGSEYNTNMEEMVRFRKEDQVVLDTGRPLYLPKMDITAADGRKRWLTRTKRKLPGKDLVLGVSVDVTEIVEAEAEREQLERQFRQAQKMQALGTLAGGIAHDFNNMIFAMLGFNRLARRLVDGLETCPQKLREHLEQVESAGLRASELVRQILTFSRQTESEKKAVHLGSLTKETARMLMATLPPDVIVETRVETPHDIVLGDPTQLHQVVLNLCTNAAQAMREKGGTLAIIVREARLAGRSRGEGESQTPGPYLELQVQDSGPGIAPEVLDRIFDPFFTTKKLGEGTGLGLSVVHGIVRSHGGTVQVESEPGRTTFSVFLPRHTAEAEAAAELLTEPPRGDERILVVDDEAVLVPMLADTLGRLGYRVSSFTSPELALVRFLEDPNGFDLLLTDQTMPGMTGIELSRRVREVRPDLPVILISGYSGSVSPDQMRKAGIGEFLLKPVMEESMAVAIRRALGGHGGHSEDAPQA